MALDARTIDELVRLNAERNKDHVAVIESPTGDQHSQSYTSKQIDDFAFQVACVYSEKYDLQPRTSSHQKPKVVALCGIGDFEYLITALAIAKLGHTTLFLSPRLPLESCVGLLRPSNAALLLVQQGQQSLAEYVNGDSLDVAAEAVAPIDQGMPTRSIEGRQNTNLTAALDIEAERNTAVWILHSSGSTGLPKLVSVPNGAALRRYTANLGSLGLDTLTTVPLYHAFGMSSFFRCFISQKTIQLYAKLPITTSHLLQATRDRMFGLFSAVPFTIKLLAESEEGMRFLRGFSVLTTGGSPMPEDLGTELPPRSETGTLLTSLRPAEDHEWSWLRVPEEDGHLLRFEHQGSDTYELICPKAWSMLADSNQDDGSWRTKDLFTKHPTIPGAFKYIGRLDDILVLENGEKFNPISVESEISSSPLIDGCIIFGTGKPAAGIAVIPSEVTDHLTKDEFRLLLRRTIDKAQTSLPMYGRITEDMILLLPRNSVAPRTDKGTIIRSKFLKAYKQQIQAIYEKQDAAVERRQYTKDEILKFLSKQLLRSAIMKHVDLGVNKLGINVVFDFPTIASLAQEISRVSSGAEASSLDAKDEQDAANMLQRYANFGGQRREPCSARTLSQNIQVLTGATGSLGAHLLAKLALSSSVQTVYCLVRASSNANAQERVEKSLEERNLRSNFPEELPRKITCLAADLSDQYLGLGKDTFRSIARDVDIVYHCGWTVNFNQRLSTFEKSCVAGVRHLLDLCLAGSGLAAARFIMFSSIGTIMSTSEDTIPERLPRSLAEANRTGYSRSKCVAEQICAKAAAEAGLQVAIVRIGQIVGDTINGIWNTSEAVPLMIRSAQTIGALPTLQERVRWLPVDDVAQIVIEIGSSDAIVANETSVFNIVNPHTLRWTKDLLPLLAQNGLAFQAVPPSDWLKRLEGSDTDPKANPPRKLLEYFRRQCQHQDSEEREWETSRADKWSPTFHKSSAPSPQLISVIVGYFKGAWKV
ncbi:male sterility protein-domain-containing protein [Fusarium oxysporum Fo47]|uniref:male sterility protein-domain-containing protein n=1 Tax=Fusarium oxysporum Fo47 TaxID=660027 RepID=UPI002869C335|nr:male sterility protein-domain-containing protein [Fusarium oxysporum Fo47]QKD55241.2 male sterility protein-domain-containing protein [Fusarium oxysporum Fo47]